MGQTTISFLDTYYDIASNIGSSEISQSVFETSGQSFSPTDLTSFQNRYDTTVQTAEVIGGHDVSSCTMANDQCTEGNLDIQYIMGMAQVTTSTYYYVGGNDPFVSYVSAIQDSSDPILVNSISWGSVEQDNPISSLSTFYTETMALAAQGVTVMVSSGDQGVSNSQCACNENSGSNTVSWASSTWTGKGYFPSFPASCPYVTAVGATMGPNNGDPEVACQADEGGVITTGGGFSTYYEAPVWQTQAVDAYFDGLAANSVTPVSGYNRQGRGYSLIGVNYPVIINGLTYLLYGTSASAPVFAAYVSLLNADRLNHSLSPVGFLNPTLYSAGNNVTLVNSTIAAFNDITVGDNFCCSGSNSASVVCCTSGFYTAIGWDPVTGWGSIDFPVFASVYGTVVTSVTSSGGGDDDTNTNTTTTIVILVLFVICAGAAIGYCCFRKKPTDVSNIPNNSNANSDGFSTHSAHNTSVNSNTNMIAQQVGYNAKGEAVYAVQQNPISNTGNGTGNGNGTATRNTPQASRTTGAAALYMNNDL